MKRLQLSSSACELVNGKFDDKAKATPYFGGDETSKQLCIVKIYYR